MTPTDLRNTHTTGNRCRDALPCINMALKLPLYFYLLMKTEMLVVHFSCTSCYYFILFQWLPKLKFLSFSTKVNPNKRSKTKSDIFHWTYSNLRSYLLYLNILKYFNDFQNWNLSILWLKWTQIMEMKQNQRFFDWTISFLLKHIKIF